MKLNFVVSRLVVTEANFSGNCGHHWAEGTYLVKDLIKGGSPLWLLVPALLYQLNALHRGMVWRHNRSTYGWGLPDLLHNL